MNSKNSKLVIIRVKVTEIFKKENLQRFAGKDSSPAPPIIKDAL